MREMSVSEQRYQATLAVIADGRTVSEVALNAAIQHVPVEGGLKLGPVVCLDPLNAERQLLEDVVDELDSRLLVEAVVHPKHPNPGAVVDRGELVMLLPSSAKRSDKLDVDLDLVARLGLFVSLPSVLVPPVALRRRQPAHIQAFEDPPDAGQADLDLVAWADKLLTSAYARRLGPHLSAEIVSCTSAPSSN